MYDNMTSYILAESPESLHHQQQQHGHHHQMNGGGGGGGGGGSGSGNNSSSNAPSLIGSPRSTPVFGGSNGHLALLQHNTSGGGGGGGGGGSKQQGGGMMLNGGISNNKSSDLVGAWNGGGSDQQRIIVSPSSQQQQYRSHHQQSGDEAMDENQSVRSDHSMTTTTTTIQQQQQQQQRPASSRSSSRHHHNNKTSSSSGGRSSHSRNGGGRREPPSASALSSPSLSSHGGGGHHHHYHQQQTMTTGGNQQHQEVIQVQILPQDDGWGDNATAITGNTSVASDDDVSRLGGGNGGGGGGDDAANGGGGWSNGGGGAMGQFQSSSNGGGMNGLGLSFGCQRYLGTVAAGLLAFLAVSTPVAMVLLPRMQIVPLRSEQLRCPAECEGLLISLTVKLVLLALGSWAVFWRPTRATMPRIFFLRTLVLLLVFVTTFAYCLFYGVRVVEQQDQLDYKAIVTFALSLVDALLFVHYTAVLLLEIRQLPPRYYVHVIRSPDGISKGYPIGALSIQRAAVWLLDKYYTDFPIFNPYLERLPPRRTRSKLLHHSSSFKFYDLDNAGGGGISGSVIGRGGGGGGALSTMTGGGGSSVLTHRRNNNSSSHNERFYEEHEYERRLKKRRARLVTSAEEAFTHIRRLQAEPGPAVPMDPYEAAQAIFPSMARPLQKYLRITRQQPRHTVESILQHLAICLSHDLSARAFVEKFLVSTPVMQNDKEKCAIQTWSLVCDVLLSRGIEEGTVFQLRQNDNVSLLCRVSTLPHFNITEEIIEPKSNKFVLRLSSETSV